MKEREWGILKGEDLALTGDGRNHSPGHSAKYCVYTLMEHYLHIIVDVEVVDKRETGGTSVTMEKVALKRLIERAMKNLKIVDLATDAFSMIIALIRTLKGQCIQSSAGWYSFCITLPAFMQLFILLVNSNVLLLECSTCIWCGSISILFLIL